MQLFSRNRPDVVEPEFRVSRVDAPAVLPGTDQGERRSGILRYKHGARGRHRFRHGGGAYSRAFRFRRKDDELPQAPEYRGLLPGREKTDVRRRSREFTELFFERAAPGQCERPVREFTFPQAEQKRFEQNAGGVFLDELPGEKKDTLLIRNSERGAEFPCAPFPDPLFLQGGRIDHVRRQEKEPLRRDSGPEPIRTGGIAPVKEDVGIPEESPPEPGEGGGTGVEKQRNPPAHSAGEMPERARPRFRHEERVEVSRGDAGEIRFTLKNQSVSKTLFDSPAAVYAVIPEELTRGKAPVDFTVNLYRDRERVASKTGDFISNLNKFSITETFPEAMFNDVTRTCEYTVELIFNGEVIAENSYLYFTD